LGPVTYLSPGESKTAKESQDRVLGRAYELWERRVAKTR
jgi:hypothetical protein